MSMAVGTQAAREILVFCLRCPAGASLVMLLLVKQDGTTRKLGTSCFPNPSYTGVVWSHSLFMINRIEGDPLLPRQLAIHENSRLYLAGRDTPLRSVRCDGRTCFESIVRVQPDTDCPPRELHRHVQSHTTYYSYILNGISDNPVELLNTPLTFTTTTPSQMNIPPLLCTSLHPFPTLRFAQCPQTPS